jgi:hypothetical protein
MANYYESARTNYFQVKDIDAFKEELKDVKSLNIIVEHRNLKDYVCLLSEYEGGFAWDYYDEAQEDYVEIDWDGIFTKHLVDGSVAIIIGAGAEKLRYVSGYAFAFNNKGETKRIALDDIYALAESLGSDVQRAEY